MIIITVQADQSYRAQVFALAAKCIGGGVVGLDTTMPIASVTDQGRRLVARRPLPVAKRIPWVAVRRSTKNRRPKTTTGQEP